MNRWTLARPLGWALPPLVAPRVTERVTGASEDTGGTVLRGRSVPGRTPLRTHPGAPPGTVGMILLGYYEWRSIVIAARVCQRGDRIVEVGAHIGTETVGFADVVGPTGRVDAFEPLPENADQLARWAAEGDLAQIEIHRAAVSDAPGRAQFAVAGPGEVTLAGHLADAPGERSITVDVVTLDDALDRPADVRLLAVDAEGADLGVLRGARDLRAASRPVVVVEALPPELDEYGRWSLADLADELLDDGYRLWRVGRLGLTPLDRSGSLEPTEPGHYNWLALAAEDAARAADISAAIRRAAFLPRPIGPLRRRS